MTDFFAVLGQSRRPWLDAEQLKDAFLTRSSTVHPDRVHSESEAPRQAADERYAELNAALPMPAPAKSTARPPAAARAEFKTE